MNLSRRRPTAWPWLAALLLALVLAPLLGQVHRALHGGGVPVPSLQAGDALAGAPHAPAAHSLAALFGTHDGADCRLYDQAGHADLMPGVPALALPELPPAVLIAFATGEAIARFAALFDARGPPSFR